MCFNCFVLDSRRKERTAWETVPTGRAADHFHSLTFWSYFSFVSLLTYEHRRDFNMADSMLPHIFRPIPDLSELPQPTNREDRLRTIIANLEKHDQDVRYVVMPGHYSAHPI